MILIILLGIVSLLLIALVIVIIILFATGVFTTQQARDPIPTSVPPIFPPGGDPLVNRTFDVQMYVVDQANNMFDNPTNFEYQQAFAMLQNAVSIIY